MLELAVNGWGEVAIGIAGSAVVVALRGFAFLVLLPFEVLFVFGLMWFFMTRQRLPAILDDPPAPPADAVFEPRGRGLRLNVAGQLGLAVINAGLSLFSPVVFGITAGIGLWNIATGVQMRRWERGAAASWFARCATPPAPRATTRVRFSPRSHTTGSVARCAT